MKIQIKQNWSNGFWWVLPADTDSRLVLRANQMDNQMLSNVQIAEITGQKWLQEFMHGVHSSKDWHTVEVPANHPLSVKVAGILAERQ